MEVDREGVISRPAEELDNKVEFLDSQNSKKYLLRKNLRIKVTEILRFIPNKFRPWKLHQVV